MQIEKINKKSISKAVKILKSGGIIVFPTETSYGIGCDFKNKQAIKRIFKIKQRPKEKNLPVICATKKMTGDFFDFNKKARELARKYWPGPLSIILNNLPVRVSSNKVATTLSKKLKRPITATSANLSGESPYYNAEDIYKNFINKKNQPDFILDAGKILKNKPSTIVKISNDKIIIIRKGSIKL